VTSSTWTSLLDFLGLLLVAAGIGLGVALLVGAPLGLVVAGLVVLLGSALAAGRFSRRTDGDR
jgi:hypothetical protein